MHLAVFVSLKKANIRLGPEVNLETLDQLTNMQLTKRIGVSQINGIYDPLGLMAPLTILYKFILQKIACLSMGWDYVSVSEGEIEQDLRKILVEMMLLNVPDIKFHQAVVPANIRLEFELLGFWDGGKLASAAVIYARYQLEESKGKPTH